MLKWWAGRDIQRWVEAKVNSTENGILLRSDLYGLFGRFKLWLEAQVVFIRILNCISIRSNPYKTGEGKCLHREDFIQ
jgi:hypothetical protein